MTEKIPALDGLRALSIGLVLAAHLLPLGPSRFQLNAAAGLMGMALFFTLSGFLIVRFLAQGMPVATFAVRRLARILPLAWAAMAMIWLVSGGNFIANFLFVSNIPPTHLMYGGEHLWSLCVEVQFYVFAGLLCIFPRRISLFAIPLSCLAVTAFRVTSGQPISIVTWHRVDEILAGGTVALISLGWLGNVPKRVLHGLPVSCALLILVACSHPSAGPLLYLRPYAAALVIGSAIFGLGAISERLLVNRLTFYIAEISYALYVVHGMLSATWLGSGNTIERYTKRPLLFATVFAIAHLSTRFFERPITRFVRSTHLSYATPQTSGD